MLIATMVAPETCVFCMLPKRDCIATQDTLYFQYFLADWADKVMALCTTVHGLCGMVHQLMLAFYVRSKGQGGVAWDTRHQGLEGGVTGFVPQGLVSQIISGQPFPMWFWTSFASGTVLLVWALKRSPSLHLRVPEEYAWSGRSRCSPGRGGACCVMLLSASRGAVLSPAIHIGIHICMHVYMYLHRSICALDTLETLSPFVGARCPDW